MNTIIHNIPMSNLSAKYQMQTAINAGWFVEERLKRAKQFEEEKKKTQ